MRGLRIGLVSARYAPEFEGGSERVVRALARGLLAAGYDVRVLAGTGREALGPADSVLREEVEGVPVTRLALVPGESFAAGLDRPRIDALAGAELADRDLVHVHHWSTLSHGLVRTLARRVPVALTLHDSFAACPRFFRASPLSIPCPPRGRFEPCGRCLAPLCAPLEPAAIAALAARRAEEFEAELGAARVHVFPSEFFRREFSAALALDSARAVVLAPGLTRSFPRPRGAASRGLLHVLHFGNLGEEKGTFDLVKAMAPLGDGRATLTLAGQATAPDFSAEVERLRGALPVRWLRGYDAEGLSRAAGEAHLAAFPSRLPESYGLVLDEAHALGLPAWVSDRGAPRERLVEGERALPAADPAAWGRALEQLSGNPDSLSSVRRRVALLDLPKVEDSVRAHEALYRSLLSEARR